MMYFLYLKMSGLENNPSATKAIFEPILLVLSA
jgi:hypothetical protein